MIILGLIKAGLAYGSPGEITGADPSKRYSAAVTESLRDSIKNKINQKWFSCGDEMICGISSIPRFYDQREYKPAWVVDDANLKLADELVSKIRTAPEEGLDPENYHLTAITELLGKVRKGTLIHPSNPAMAADLDLLLTDAFLLYASHLISGRVDPENLYAEWESTSPESDLAKLLDQALASRKISSSLDPLGPQHQTYQKLKLALIKYRALVKNGGWKSVPEGPSLRIHDRDPRVEALRTRLAASGDMADLNGGIGFEFDVDLLEGVKKFQDRHGLEKDGIVGKRTIAAMNVSAEHRLRQIELNLERWRWIPRDLGKRYILVNIAAFKLYVVEGLETVMEMRVVVGKPFRQTPVFSRDIQYLVLNPYWNVPFTIAVKDLLPEICRNINSLYKKDISVFDSWREDAVELDPRTIPWCRLNQKNFRYKLRQNPGPKNSLGRIKFMLPNPYSVYLHDTPQKDLFERASRNFSSGCIRLERPYDLAFYLLQNEEGQWTRENFFSYLDAGKRKVILLKNRVPVHLLYWTAWADPDGTVHFQEDIYDRDKALDLALKTRVTRKSINSAN